MKIPTLLLSLVVVAGASAAATTLKSPSEAPLSAASAVQEKPAEETSKSAKNDAKAEKVTLWVLEAAGKG